MNIFIVGPMGSGKSTVGKIISSELFLNFFDTDEEIEIRIASIYTTALLTESINKRRPEDKAIIIPQLDYRLWKNYHATHYPHHLTYTTMY